MKLGNKVKLLAAVCVVDLFLAGGMAYVAGGGEGRSAWVNGGCMEESNAGHVEEGSAGHAEDVRGTWVQEGGDALERTRGLEGKCVALTFDDGPHEEYTKELLDGLQERGVKATFFLMGQNIEGNEDLVKRMKDEGHLIGNHSYSHVQLTKAGAKAVCDAVDRTSRMIEDITGEKPGYMRPPFGDWNEQLECQVGMTTVMWSVDSLDWKLQDKDRIVRRVLKEAENGDIILMHDIFPASVKAALEIVDTLTKQGYTFVTVDELLID